MSLSLEAAGFGGDALDMAFRKIELDLPALVDMTLGIAHDVSHAAEDRLAAVHVILALRDRLSPCICGGGPDFDGPG